ncbi:MAG: hypothetical protein IT372_16745 [Polyangiaceae bacterium]|nr:hypothetical protein [Polyangiaceae bacterium]
MNLSLSTSPAGIVEGALLPDGAVALQWIEAERPSWVRLAGPRFVAPPAVVADRQGQLWVFALDASGVVHANVRRDDLGWSGWRALDGLTLTDALSVCLDSGGRVVVFGRGADGAVWHRWYDGADWSAWVSLDGAILDAPSAVLTADGRLVVFAIGTDRALWHRFHDNGWSPWTSLGGAYTSSPAATLDGVGVLSVFGRGTDNALWLLRHDTKWQPSIALGGGLAGAPAAAVDRAGRLCVRVVGTDGVLIHERQAITAWSDYAAVDRLPQEAFAPIADEETRRARDAWKGNPAVVQAATTIADALRVTVARALLSARDPALRDTLTGFEQRMAQRFARSAPDMQARLETLAAAELRRFEELRASQPALWGRVDLRAAEPVTDQLVAAARPAFAPANPAVSPASPARVELRVRPRFRPQGGNTMQFRIHSVCCVEETDEAGDDTITMAGFTIAPNGKPAAFGPFELGDFSTTDGPDERWRHFDITDSRANFRWHGAAQGSADRPYLVSLTLTEVDGDLDGDFMTGVSRVVDLASGAIATTGPWGVVAAAAIELAWALLSTWWKDATNDEVAPALVFEGWAGMPGANTPRTTWLQWDGGRYELTYSWSPPDPVMPFNFDNLPPVRPETEREFTLLDAGPFTHIGATCDRGSFGLWARKPDGRVVFRDHPDAAWINVPDAVVAHIDNGWAVIGTSAARFDQAAKTYENRISREVGAFTHILHLSRVAGATSTLAWGLAGGAPYREGPSSGSASGGPLDSHLATLHWNWDAVPSNAKFEEVFVAPGDMNGRVWTIDAQGIPYQYTNGFTAHPASFRMDSLCVVDAGDVFGIARGQTYHRAGAGAWEAFLCYELRNGTKVPLVARQMRYTGHFGTYLSRHYLLTATGKLYVSLGSRLA